MTKRHNTKYKIDRRLGVNLWGRPKSPFNRRNSKPGQHGVQGQRKKLSDYGNQLFAKQKLKFYYGDLTERQFRNIFKKASNTKGDTSQILIELLERRLDATVYRMKFVPTIFAARQLVNHGHVKVNGKRVNIPSFSVSDGDEISIKDKSKEINIPSLHSTAGSPELLYLRRGRNLQPSSKDTPAKSSSCGVTQSQRAVN